MRLLAVLIVCMLAVGLGLVIARTRPNEDELAVQYRQALMTVLDGTAEPLLEMQRGDRTFDQDLVRRHASELAVLAGMVPESFARDTHAATHLESAALPYVWSDASAFAADAHQLQLAASALQRATDGDTRSQLVPAIQALGAACSLCHRQFRAP